VLTARWLGLPPSGGALFALPAGSYGVLGHDRGGTVDEAAVAGDSPELPVRVAPHRLQAPRLTEEGTQGFARPQSEDVLSQLRTYPNGTVTIPRLER